MNNFKSLEELELMEINGGVAWATVGKFVVKGLIIGGAGVTGVAAGAVAVTGAYYGTKAVVNRFGGN